MTIFVSTHFINEAMRCDRISLMNAGKVLVIDTPRGWSKRARRRDAGGGLHRLPGGRVAAEAPSGSSPSESDRHEPRPAHARATGGRSARSTLRLAHGSASGAMLAYSSNEAMQIRRDPVRLAFAFVGSALLMLVFGFGITIDVEHVRYASFDLDRSPESRDYLAILRGAALLHRDRRRSNRAEEGDAAASIGRHIAHHGDSA